MPKFRKKPVVIEAVRFLDPMETAAAIDFLNFIAKSKRAIDIGETEPVIHTLEGDMKVSNGDWIIRGVQGEYYPCKPDIFDATYEPAGE